MVQLLIVEDDGPLRQCMTEILEDEGYRVVTAVHGQAALVLLETIVPALIVTDVMMPVMDGLELCTQVRTTPATAHIPIVVCSAGADKPDQQL
jgi:CheY-like chemotaxis protein